MQFMLGIVCYVVKEKVSCNIFFQVDDNVEYGVQYLCYLMDKLNNNFVLVFVFYNVGWCKVLEWLFVNEVLFVDIWIENIFYKEICVYVKVVMVYQYIYDQQLGGNENIFF